MIEGPQDSRSIFTRVERAPDHQIGAVKIVAHVAQLRTGFRITFARRQRTIRHLDFRTPTYEPEGREFESLRAHHFPRSHLALLTSSGILRFSLIAGVVARPFRGEVFPPIAEKSPASEDACYSKSCRRTTDVNRAKPSHKCLRRIRRQPSWSMPRKLAW